nr:hypothetical protein [Tanacetum cinerariifolium]
MSSITAQQTKLDLKLVPKENRLDIRKCNGKIPRRLTPREPTFQVVMDAIALTPSYLAFLITADVPEGRDFDALPFEEDIVSFLRELGHTGVMNSLNDVVIDQMHQPWRTFTALINRALTSPEMKESKAYKTYLGYASGAVPPKIDRKFKKASPSKKDNSLVPIDDEPAKKCKRVKRSVKKSTTTPASALTEEAQMKEARKKILRYFHKTHPSGSGTVTKNPPRVDKITPTVTSEGTDDKPGVPDVTEDDSTESELESWGNDKNDSNDDNDSKNEGNDEENKSDDDKAPCDSEKGLDSKQDTDGSESDSEFDQQEYEEEVKYDDEEEDKIIHTLSNSDDEEDAN